MVSSGRGLKMRRPHKWALGRKGRLLRDVDLREDDFTEHPMNSRSFHSEWTSFIQDPVASAEPFI